VTWDNVLNGVDLVSAALTQQPSLITDALGADILNNIFIQLITGTADGGWLVWIFWATASIVLFLLFVSWVFLILDPVIRRLSKIG